MSAQNKRDNTRLLWYEVKIPPGKELQLRDELENNMGKVVNINGCYCPIRTTHDEYYKQDDGWYLGYGGKPKKKSKSRTGLSAKMRDLPLFSGRVFVHGTEAAIAWFLEERPPLKGSILYSAIVGDGENHKPVTIPEEQMEKLRNFNENFIDDPILLRHPFNDYAFNEKKGEPNETIKIVDGPLAGKTGYLIRIGRNRSKGMAFQMENPSGKGYIPIGISNILDYHIVRVHNAEMDPAVVATRKPRAVDMLVGMILGAGLKDEDVMETLYDVVEKLVQNKTFAKAAVSLGKEIGNPSDAKARLSEVLKATDIERQRLILNLIRYEETYPGYVKSNWRNFVFRPFLTPTSGIKPLEGKGYAILHHDGFEEIIVHTSISEWTYYPKEHKGGTEKAAYYAHVGIKEQGEGEYLFFTNWDGLLSKYFMTGGAARNRLLKEPHVPLTDNKGKSGQVKDINGTGSVRDTKKLMESFFNYCRPLFDVLTGQCAVKPFHNLVLSSGTIDVLGIKVEGIGQDLSIDELLALQSVTDSISMLIGKCVEICQSLSSTPHLKAWRDYLNTVWLHK